MPREFIQSGQTATLRFIFNKEGGGVHDFSSGVWTFIVRLTSPSGTSVDKTASLVSGTTNEIEYTLAKTDVTTAGQWKAQGIAEKSPYYWPSEFLYLQVSANLPAPA